ncbi:leucine Rich repeat protein [Perkinsela sp. CCAP 1560/4]|nr:leucine Rich repeat protein [Perkinsela sp. CCAP 1560/4]|eukprot:KNH00571.1 leucine Rich repeat protein [Perkinsela sp. CCAP 1560/4]
MINIFLNMNAFSGTISLGHLPPNLQYLGVCNNKLTGKVRVPPGVSCVLDGNENLTVDDSVAELRFKFQMACMRKTAENYHVYRSRRHQKENCCFWMGVTCQVDIVIGIYWSQSDSVTIKSLAWLPPSLQRATLIVKRIYTHFEMQRLPKHLRYANFPVCGLHGPLELRTLPKELAELLLPANNFTGEIRLTSLPPHMQKLDLQSNRIMQAFVCNAQLPISLEVVQLFSEKRPRFVCLDGKNVDRRVCRRKFDSLYD